MGYLQAIDTAMFLLAELPEAVVRLRALRDELERFDEEGREPTEEEWAEINDRVADEEEAILAAHGGLDDPA